MSVWSELVSTGRVVATRTPRRFVSPWLVSVNIEITGMPTYSGPFNFWASVEYRKNGGSAVKTSIFEYSVDLG